MASLDHSKRMAGTGTVAKNQNTVKKPGKGPRGPKPYEPDEDQKRRLRELAIIGCSLREIAVIEGVSLSTVQRRFSEIIEAGVAERRRGLRKKQLARALEGSDTMLIWLGKQDLGQRDHKEVRHDVADSLSDLLEEVAKNGARLSG